MRVYKHESSTPERVVFLLRNGEPMGLPVPGHAVLYVMTPWVDGRPAKYRIGNVQDVWVRPDLRGKGHGRTLMEGVVHHAKILGLRSLTLTSNGEREAARGLYATLGFRRVTDGFRLVLEGAGDGA